VDSVRGAASEDPTIERSVKPDSPLAAIGNAMLEAAEKIDPSDDLRAVVLLRKGTSWSSCLGGYEKDTDAVADLLVHVEAILRANGKRMEIVTL
jgi:hypothetical protein